MTEKQFYQWQTEGGTDDVMRFVNALEAADILWCTIGGIAVNHWASEQMVTLDVDFVVAAESVEKAESTLVKAGFTAEHHEWSINFKGRSKVSIQLTTEEGYRDFAERGVAADVHGILMRVASLEDTLTGKIRAWSDPKRRQSKRFKDLADITRLVEAHPELWKQLPDSLRSQIDSPRD